jgi:hypothetical protein
MTVHWHDDECGWCPCDEGDGVPVAEHRGVPPALDDPDIAEVDPKEADE